MNAYLDCLKLEMDAAAPKDPSKLSPRTKKKAEANVKVLTQKNNAAVDELQAVVGRFNEQLKIYKAKHISDIGGRGGSVPPHTLRIMQASTLITPRLAEEAINSRLTCLPIESLPLTQCVGGTLRENIYAERDHRLSIASPWTASRSTATRCGAGCAVPHLRRTAGGRRAAPEAQPPRRMPSKS